MSQEVRQMKALLGGVVLGATLSMFLTSGIARAESPAAPSESPGAPTKSALERPRPVPPGRSWNLPPGGIDWAKFKGKVVLIDFWNQK
jgi:hypothetical protein